MPADLIRAPRQALARSDRKQVTLLREAQARPRSPRPSRPSS